MRTGIMTTPVQARSQVYTFVRATLENADWFHFLDIITYPRQLEHNTIRMNDL